MKITGELLKSERINKNLTVQDVALSLKLSSKLVNALEAGNLDDLPAKTFVRGFVKSYAQLLKLDADIVLRQFQEEMGSTSPLPKVPPPTPTPNMTETIKAQKPALKHTSQNYANKTPTAPQQANLNKEKNTKQIVIMISVAVVLVLALVIGNKVFENFKSDPIAIEVPVKAQVATSNSADGSPATSSDLTNAALAASADTQVAVMTSKDATAATEEVIPPPTVEDVVATQSTINTSAPEGGFQKSNGKPVEIMLEAKKDTEIFYAKGDSKQFVSLKLAAGHVEVIRSKVGLYIKVADAGSVKLSVNGIDTGYAGANNKEVKLSF
jgi:cytoskeleton protein RodZ